MGGMGSGEWRQRGRRAVGAARRGWTPLLLRRLVFDHSGRKRGMRWRLTTALAACRSGLVGPADSRETGMEQECTGNSPEG